MNEEEKKAIEYYQDKEVSFGFECDLTMEQFLKALGIEEKEEDSFENHQIRFKTLLNLIEKQQKEIENSVSKDKIRERKIIDKMAEFLYKNDSNFGYGNLKYVNTPEKIKQYFERKVEND